MGSLQAAPSAGGDCHCTCTLGACLPSVEKGILGDWAEVRQTLMNGPGVETRDRVTAWLVKADAVGRMGWGDPLRG